MAKPKIVFICSHCGTKHTKWEGKCSSCGEWNTMEESVETKSTNIEEKRGVWAGTAASNSAAIPIQDIRSEHVVRLSTEDEELDRVLGGGIVNGSMILLGGQPGIGKSTLLLQMALHVNLKILYVSGEESGEQIKMRAVRVGIKNQNCLIYSETNVIKILKQAKASEAHCVVIDSIQTLVSPHIDSMAGSISQLKECAGEIQRFAKEMNMPFFVIGHITKDGQIAGPKLLEHVVDVVLHFEGDQHYSYRILRSLKNRFGSTNEIGIYEMVQNGLREVNNPSELLISQHEVQLSGSAIGAAVEGLRPLLIETQALVSSSVYGNPQRSTTGFDGRRLSMLLAVLEKRCGLPFVQSDVFLNIAGGIKISDPSIDLSIVASLISSLHDIPLTSKICFTGEIGLSGEVRAVSFAEQRIQEAERLGFETIYVSKYNSKAFDLGQSHINIVGISSVVELLDDLFS